MEPLVPVNLLISRNMMGIASIRRSRRVPAAADGRSAWKMDFIFPHGAAGSRSWRAERAEVQ
ncbi:MAG TPA: hypothetical protein IAC35_07150 [Candidatus Cryptobacteroides merdipullorum]|uniref:Uncharacterized protein n=1 Tax=Candidatus Cryptobacteroides merdipullorum TaxID=2840771 RepID=A0A9D1GPE2_9BACT|nr:hypothetical protein [Candidatus Cryptobacteroides merdipullorum]